MSIPGEKIGSSSHLVKVVRIPGAIVMDWISGSMDDAQSKQIEVCAAIHGAFDQLQTMNVSFHHAIAPRLLKDSQNHYLVVAEVLGEEGQRAGLRCLTPVRPGSGIALPDDAKELPC